MNNETLGELVLELEQDFISGGGTLMSKYVTTDLYEDINTIYAYLSSKHISGTYDSMDREKPFFNIVVSNRNIWFRATDIDTKQIILTPTKEKDIIGTFLLSVHLQKWMKEQNFGIFLNKWGLELSGFNSAVVKVVEKGDELNIDVVPWSRLIVDQINFESNPKIEILELTEQEMYDKYPNEKVAELLSAKKARELTNKQKQDTKSRYFKVYEIHGNLPLAYLTGEEKDERTPQQQMQAISFLKKVKGKGMDTFALFSGKEEKDPYYLTSLIPSTDGSISLDGAVKNLFQAQWMINHNKKLIKDQLDQASKLFYQTADSSFVGQNAVNDIENGDVLIHLPNMPLTQVNNTSHDITSLQNFGTEWKSLASEINGISEAMLGAMPKSGTAWRQTEAILSESYNLFEIMTENKGLCLVKIIRERVLPHLLKKMDTNEEVSATLDMYGIDKIEKKYIRNKGIENFNSKVYNALIEGKPINDITVEGEMADVEEGLKSLGNQRFFTPSEYKKWKDEFKDLDYDAEIDVTGEATATQEALATISTALKVVADPNYANNPTAQFLVGKILMRTGHLSQLELSQIPKPVAPQGGEVGATVLPDITQIKQ